MKKYTLALFAAVALVLAMGNISAFAFTSEVGCKLKCGAGGTCTGSGSKWQCDHGGAALSAEPWTPLANRDIGSPRSQLGLDYALNPSVRLDLSQSAKLGFPDAEAMNSYYNDVRLHYQNRLQDVQQSGNPKFIPDFIRNYSTRGFDNVAMYRRWWNEFSSLLIKDQGLAPGATGGTEVWVWWYCHRNYVSAAVQKCMSDLRSLE
ncbi:MAG: hypothetical protein K8R48_01485 [Alphaproteobacteria bacterium]|nr:hypothetical protein [Alphaproteobacteria bacterium]